MWNFLFLFYGIITFSVELMWVTSCCGSDNASYLFLFKPLNMTIRLSNYSPICSTTLVQHTIYRFSDASCFGTCHAWLDWVHIERGTYVRTFLGTYTLYHGSVLPELYFLFQHQGRFVPFCHRQQNKCYLQMCLLAHFEATLILAVANLLAHNNISQICYCGLISLQSAAVNCCFSDNVTPLGVTVILLAMVPRWETSVLPS